MTKLKPFAYFACDPDTKLPVWDEGCVCEDDIYSPDDTGTFGRGIVFFDQAEAYAAAKVREALEQAATVADRQHFGGDRDDDLSWTDCAAQIAASIRALKSEKTPSD